MKDARKIFFGISYLPVFDRPDFFHQCEGVLHLIAFIFGVKINVLYDKKVQSKTLW